MLPLTRDKLTQVEESLRSEKDVKSYNSIKNENEELRFEIKRLMRLNKKLTAKNNELQESVANHFIARLEAVKSVNNLDLNKKIRL